MSTPRTAAPRARPAVAKALAEPLQLFFVQQNIDYLTGEFLVSAVVAGPSTRAVLKAIQTRFPDPDEDETTDWPPRPQSFLDRLTVTALGRVSVLPAAVGVNKVGPRKLGHGCVLLSAEIGGDFDV